MSQPPPVILEDPDEVRDLCRCPNPACRVIWTHFEGKTDRRRTLRETVEYVKTHYGADRPYQCPECGTWSVLRAAKPGFWETLAGNVRWRLVVPTPAPDVPVRERAAQEQEAEIGE